MERRALTHVVNECFEFIGTRVKFLLASEEVNDIELAGIASKLNTAFIALTELHLSHYHKNSNGARASSNLIVLIDSGVSISHNIVTAVWAVERLVGLEYTGEAVYNNRVRDSLFVSRKMCHLYGVHVLAMFD